MPTPRFEKLSRSPGRIDFDLRKPKPTRHACSQATLSLSRSSPLFHDMATRLTLDVYSHVVTD
jgi:hypothetical protein